MTPINLRKKKSTKKKTEKICIDKDFYAFALYMALGASFMLGLVALCDLLIN